jgi:hypothetical protein
MAGKKKPVAPARDKMTAQAIADDLVAVCKKHNVRLYPIRRSSVGIEDMFGDLVWDVDAITSDGMDNAELGASYDNE